jgi:hypothetical protein
LDSRWALLKGYNKGNAKRLLIASEQFLKGIGKPLEMPNCDKKKFRK